jgi:recA bacterial DNA recombination protein
MHSTTLATGIQQVDQLTGGIPLGALSEICGSSPSSGKTSVLMSLIAQSSQKHLCALVDATDSFDPESAAAIGVSFPRLLWVRCGKNQTELSPLQQAFKVADILLENGMFGLIAVDISGIPERFVAQIPASRWFRFSQMIEQQPSALVFLERNPHAISYASLVLQMKMDHAIFSGDLLTGIQVKAELIRTRKKEMLRSEEVKFCLETPRPYCQV